MCSVGTETIFRSYPSMLLLMHRGSDFQAQMMADSSGLRCDPCHRGRGGGGYISYKRLNLVFIMGIKTPSPPSPTPPPTL